MHQCVPVLKVETVIIPEVKYFKQEFVWKYVDGWGRYDSLACATQSQHSSEVP